MSDVPTPPSAPTPPPKPPQAQTEHTRWSPGLIGFYLSCAGASGGAGFAFGSWFFFRSVGGLVVFGIISLVSCVTCYTSLKAARRPPE
ncbi:MAG: hypothetical protein H6835_06125 [Planctomycetes bacterium]|nr:hypothetical protein [Planctomycetota bacterium]